MRVLAIGDSLMKAEADGGRGWARRFAERLATERGAPLEFTNEGVSGDTVVGVRKRLATALAAALRWDLVILGVGINDSRRRGHPPARREVGESAFRAGCAVLVEHLAHSDAVEQFAVAGIVPVGEESMQPFKEDKYYDRADALRYAHVLREVAASGERGLFFNFTHYWQGLTEPQRRRLLPDGLHPGPAGHAQLADVAYRAWEGGLV